MNARDGSTITTIGVLVAALTALLQGLGVVVPIWIPAAIPILVGVALFAARAYIGWVGADQTTVDERLRLAQDLIDSVRAVVLPGRRS